MHPAQPNVALHGKRLPNERVDTLLTGLLVPPRELGIGRGQSHSSVSWPWFSGRSGRRSQLAGHASRWLANADTLRVSHSPTHSKGDTQTDAALY